MLPGSCSESSDDVYYYYYFYYLFYLFYLLLYLCFYLQFRQVLYVFYGLNSSILCYFIQLLQVFKSSVSVYYNNYILFYLYALFF